MTILLYSPENLTEALKNDCTPAESIKYKKHFDYLSYYLGEEGLQAQSIVIEKDYISKDYLHDYTTYYALCKKEYGKHCKRVHFFKTTITEDLLNKALLGSAEIPDDFWEENYLGFIVVKPIPRTIIGFTVLKHYNSSELIPNRIFWGTRKYKIHLFGKELSIDSLAFQEQDSVLAACATTAVWSMLNVASEDSYTILKSPSEITRDADNVSQDGSRLFPNKGLSILQICKAIVSSGLDTELINPNVELLDGEGNSLGNFVSNQSTKKIINAYSPIKIPIILVVNVPAVNGNGLHAITISGFRHKDPEYGSVKPEISWWAENIDRIYAHDDQYGPFARVDFLDEDVDIKTPWTDDHKDNAPTRVTNIIVPVYPKIRISYSDIEEIIINLDDVLSTFFDAKIKFDLIWDIKIQYSEQYKSLLKDSFQEDSTKLALLKESMPKYIWIAKCFIGPHGIFEFTFDATGVNNEMLGIHLFSNLPAEGKSVLKDWLTVNQSKFESESQNWFNIQYYRFLLEHL